MKAVILAGGKGTRMGKLTRETPKPMLEIGGKPVLAHQVELLKKYNITDIIVLVNYLKQSIIEYFGDGSAWGVSISYYEEKEPLGTVGGIKAIEDQLKDDFIVFYGDVMINMHLERLLAFHQKHKSECTLVLHPNDHPHDSDLVAMNEEHRIVNFYPKPHPSGSWLPNMVNAGVYVLSDSILPHLKKDTKADFGRDIFPELFHTLKMYGYNTAEYLKDMGTPSRWEEVNDDYNSGKIALSSYEHKQKAIFLDRDGVINEEVSFISRPEEFRLYSFTSQAIRLINDSAYKAIAITNQSVIARNLCTFEELREVHCKMDTLLGKEGARLDALYFCPHHPDKGYPEERKEYKIDCLCRKPQPGMLLDAAFDFNLDLKRSFMIGDTERDILAGINAGCTTIGVRTGYGLKKTGVYPDFFFENILEAVQFIVGDPYSELYDRLNSLESPTPTVVLIGGNARSGKSTLAAYLNWRLERTGKTVLKVELDNWILPEDQREQCKNVYDRFRLDDIETDIQRILSGLGLKQDRYINHPWRSPDKVYYNYTGQDFVLVEGVVALSSEVLRNLAHYRIFVHIEPDMHRKRIREYYQWRGKNDEEIDSIYASRSSDEYEPIEKERKFADFVVNPEKP